jgi:phosphate transport system substrate-binding protein
MNMQRILLLVLLGVLSLLGYADDNKPTPIQPTADMKGISTSNFPIIDGSDSTEPLRDILMCKLLGFKYKWERSLMVQYGGPYGIEPQYTCPQEEWSHLELDCLLNSNTHGSFINLIDGRVEVIFTARSMSRDEIVYAKEKGVELIEKPIAKDALAFLVNPANIVDDLSIEQIQGIYTGDISDWSEVGGADMTITPYVRNRNSGSQEKFETMVMAGLTIKDFPEMQIGTGMMAPYYQLERDKSGIAYSPFYYYGVMVANGLTKAIGVNGISMNKENIRNNTYPYVTDVYAAVRSDIDKSSMAYKLFEYITTEKGQDIVEESGYIPLRDFSDIKKVEKVKQSEKYYDLQGRPVVNPMRGIYIKDGKKVIIGQ